MDLQQRVSSERIAYWCPFVGCGLKCQKEWSPARESNADASERGQEKAENTVHVN